MPGIGTDLQHTPAEARPAVTYWQRYRLRWMRRRLLWRAYRARHDLEICQDNTKALRQDGPILVACIRDEALRLPYFLEHYRKLGVVHFLIIDNDSTDDSATILQNASDISIWRTRMSYRNARFGMDWINHLLSRFGHDRWCIVADCDELLTFDRASQIKLAGLTQRLEEEGRRLFGATMLELFPKGSVGAQSYTAGQDPRFVLNYFDPLGYRKKRQWPMGNLWVQGGPRDRFFFANQRDRAPTLNKFPLIKWHWRWCFVNSTHALLPRHLNFEYDGPGDTRPSGAILHTKFLPDVGARAQIDAGRGEHFYDPSHFQEYYRALSTHPDLWHTEASPYQGTQSLIKAGLIPPIS